MPVEFGYFLSLVLVSRLGFTFRDEALGKKEWLMMTLIQVLGILAFGFRIATLVLAVLVGVNNFVFYRLEKNKKSLNLKRMGSFGVLFVLATVFFSSWVNLTVTPAVAAFLGSLPFYSVLLSGAAALPAQKTWLVLAGGLFVTNEVNILIRFLFEHYQLIPRFGQPQEKHLLKSVDRREYNAGRVIGILERLFVYYFVLIGQFAAIGLILTAKSFARFKDLDQREFAEYVLIGTLLSTLLAMLTGTLIKALVG